MTQVGMGMVLMVPHHMKTLTQSKSLTQVGSMGAVTLSQIDVSEADRYMKAPMIMSDT